VRARGLLSLELVTQALTTETAKVRCWPNPDGREEEDTCAQENKRREVSRDKSKEHTSNFRKEDKRMLLLRPTKKKDRMETMNQGVCTRAFFYFRHTPTSTHDSFQLTGARVAAAIASSTTAAGTGVGSKVDMQRRLFKTLIT